MVNVREDFVCREVILPTTLQSLNQLNIANERPGASQDNERTLIRKI